VSTATAVKPGVLAQLPRAIAKVLGENLQPADAALFTARFLDGFCPAKLPQRGETRFLGIHPRFDVRLRAHLDVRAHLVVHVSVELALAEQSAKSGPN
jgi:hypothetical protein